ncbi:MAG: hypothetical protein LBB56_02345 [Chitinispirillales bacterium]|jgi:hypothetical protein|nr:hypothetical protein [Chitinispirillales bacterium]
MAEEQNVDELNKLNAILSKKNRRQLMEFACMLFAEQRSESQESEVQKENDTDLFF